MGSSEERDVTVIMVGGPTKEAHRSYGGMGTILLIKVSPESASQFGELVADPKANELLHYTDKPESFVSDRINCGVYIFTPEIFYAIQGVSTQRKDRAILRRVSSFEALELENRYNLDTTALKSSIKNILSPLAGRKQFCIYETLDFLEQIKTPGMSLKCLGSTLPSSGSPRHTFLRVEMGPGMLPSWVMYIFIPRQKFIQLQNRAKCFHLSQCSDCYWRQAGSCIILDDVEIKENAVVIYAIVGWKSSIGRWSRFQKEIYEISVSAYPPTRNEILVDSLFGHSICITLPQQASGDYYAKLGVTILGESVSVEDGVVVMNSIVLPKKTLNVSVQEEIIL